MHLSVNRKFFSDSALASLRVVSGVGLVTVISLFGGTGCGTLGLTYSLTGMYVLPAVSSTCVPPGAVAQFNAYGTYTESGHAIETKDITNQVSWAATFPELATVSASGLATASSDYTGTTGIYATIQGEFGVLTSTTSLQVSTQCDSSSSGSGSGSGSVVTGSGALHILPGNQDLNVGQTLQPLAVTTASNRAPTIVLSRNISWTTSDPNVAVVNANGVIEAVGPGDATITASRTEPGGKAVSATETLHIVQASE